MLWKVMRLNGDHAVILSTMKAIMHATVEEERHTLVFKSGDLV